MPDSAWKILIRSQSCYFLTYVGWAAARWAYHTLTWCCSAFKLWTCWNFVIDKISSISLFTWIDIIWIVMCILWGFSTSIEKFIRTLPIAITFCLSLNLSVCQLMPIPLKQLIQFWWNLIWSKVIILSCICMLQENFEPFHCFGTNLPPETLIHLINSGSFP